MQLLEACGQMSHEAHHKDRFRGTFSPKQRVLKAWGQVRPRHCAEHVPSTLCAALLSCRQMRCSIWLTCVIVRSVATLRRHIHHQHHLRLRSGAAITETAGAEGIALATRDCQLTLPLRASKFTWFPSISFTSFRSWKLATPSGAAMLAEFPIFCCCSMRWRREQKLQNSRSNRALSPSTRGVHYVDAAPSVALASP